MNKETSERARRDDDATPGTVTTDYNLGCEVRPDIIKLGKLGRVARL